MSFLIQSTLFILKAWTYVYELLTWPIYTFYQKDVNLVSIDGIEKSSKIFAMPVDSKDPSSSWRNIESLDHLSTTMVPGCQTLDDLFLYACSKWSNKRALGTRKVVCSEMEKQKNGKMFKKLTLEKYYWESYSKINERVDNFGRGLIKLGLKPHKDVVLIFAETRSEWMISAQACFRFSLPIVTLYSTLGEEAIVHGIVESETSAVVTSDELLPRLKKVISRCDRVKHIIYMNDGVFCKGYRDESNKDSLEKQLISSVELHTMTAVEQLGLEPDNEDILTLEQYKPSKESLALIMYTSGSTGIPKGVMITHRNLMAAMAGQFQSLPPFDSRSDVYVGYLPLAHVLELCCEIVVLSHGISIGYSSPQTLTDKSTKIKAGTKGDIRVLKPTLMACVPTILDRITKSVWERATDNGPLFLEMFRWAYNYKRSRMDRGYPSVFMDHLIFRKIKKLLGGRLRCMLSGGAPLSPEAQNFINICFCPIIQGYGLTETCGAATLMFSTDSRTGHVGPPVTSVQIKLRDWDEGGYSPKDLPKPRGEILIGGDIVTSGYYKEAAKTAEDFFKDKNGVNWFCTGDIGMFHQDGSLSIVDRKKDLLKLQGGEYVSLARVELALLACPLVESVCVCGDSLTADFLVAIISPNQKHLMQLANSADNGKVMDFEAACLCPKVTEKVLEQLKQFCIQKGLPRQEIPQRIHLDPKSWTPESGLVTDALKLKRKVIGDTFRTEIKSMLKNV